MYVITRWIVYGFGNDKSLLVRLSSEAWWQVNEELAVNCSLLVRHRILRGRVLRNQRGLLYSGKSLRGDEAGHHWCYIIYSRLNGWLWVKRGKVTRWWSSELRFQSGVRMFSRASYWAHRYAQTAWGLQGLSKYRRYIVSMSHVPRKSF